MSSNKLHPIYVALDSHQFNKAIKLCVGLPATNTMAQALLVHAYAKAGQRYKALVTLRAILGNEGFPELDLAIKYSLDRRHQLEEQKSKPPPPSTASRKGGKKGKKKAAPVSSPPASQSSTVSDDLESWDLIDQLDTPPELPDDWEKLPPAEKAPTDQTLLSTLASVMLKLLNLPLSTFQLFGWAASVPRADELSVRKAFLMGLHVLVSPQYEHLTVPILANMQVLALQLSRIQQQQYNVAPAAGWAAQTALWQIQYAGNVHDDKEAQRLAMLPRLAESLASKCVEQVELTTPEEEQGSLEELLLYLRTLEQVEKYDEMLSALNDRLPELKDAEQVSPHRQILLESKLQVLEKLKRYDEAQSLLESELLKQYPDNWYYWMKHLQLNMDGKDDTNDGSLEGTETLASTIQTATENSRLRGPLLIQVELAAVRFQRNSESDDLADALMERIKAYSDKFCSSTSCAFSDLESYLDLLLKAYQVDRIRNLLEWVSGIRVEPSSEDAKERRRELRAYIFSVRVALKITSSCSELKDEFLPDWKDVIRVWREYQTFEISTGCVQEQKENRPGDELFLIATRLILDGPIVSGSLVLAAALLESGIQYSPDNPYLKISAIFVYGRLNAVDRAWEFFQQLEIKHIQFETCSYLILPILRSGGFYRESISVCQEILRLQSAHIREAGEFSGKAMEHGTLTKAEEFLSFQRGKLNKSLTILEAKGVILDFAPVSWEDEKLGVVGAAHGITGAETDLKRASRMVSEAYNPLAAFSLLRLDGASSDDVDSFVDSRDLSILSSIILDHQPVSSRNRIINDCRRCSRNHNILIRAALCVNAAKGPKKGKLVAVQPELKRRCESLRACLTTSDDKIDDSGQAPGYASFRLLVLTLGSIVVGLSGGKFPGEDLTSSDTLEYREEQTAFLLRRACALMEEARDAAFSPENGGVSQVSLALSDYVVPIFALFQMCGTLVDMFGWGRRKAKTKKCATELAALALTFASTVDQMATCVAGPPDHFLQGNDEQETVFQELLGDKALVEATRLQIESSREQTQSRIEAILAEIKTTLEGFNIDEK